MYYTRAARPNQDARKGGLSLRGGSLHSLREGFGGFDGFGGSGERLALLLLVLHNTLPGGSRNGFGGYKKCFEGCIRFLSLCFPMVLHLQTQLHRCQQDFPLIVIFYLLFDKSHKIAPFESSVCAGVPIRQHREMLHIALSKVSRIEAHYSSPASVPLLAVIDDSGIEDGEK